VSDEPTTSSGTSVSDEPIEAFADTAGNLHPALRAISIVGITALVLGLLVVPALGLWLHNRPTNAKQGAQEAAAACDTWNATKDTGATIADFDKALAQSRDAVKLDPIWSSLDQSLFSAIGALVYLKKVPANPTRAQEYAAQTMQVQYDQATQALADQCALAKAGS